MTRKHEPPSRLRYEAANPTVSFRVKKRELVKLREMQEKTGLSLARILRRSLGLDAKRTKEAYKRGYEKGFHDAFGRFEAPCNVCGEPMRFDTKWEDRPEVREIVVEAFADWYHQGCR